MAGSPESAILRGNFVARSRDNDRHLGKPISEGWLEASRSGREGYFETDSKEGVPLEAALVRLPIMGWTVSVGASKAILNGPLRRSLWIVGTISTGFILLALAFSLLAARPVIAAMQSLQSASSSLMLDGPPVKLARTGLLEVDIALTAFERAAVSIREREKRHAMLVNELNHRVKNTLAVVQSLALLAKQTSTSVSEYSANFIGRVASLARTHDLLTKRNWESVPIREIFDKEIAVFQNVQNNRISLSGDSIQLSSRSAVTLGMIAHELATNAAKYGALSCPEGKVAISWSQSANDEIQIHWVETEGPPVQPPSSQSFGTKLITSLALGLEGMGDMDFRPSGLRFSLTFRDRKEQELLL